MSEDRQCAYALHGLGEVLMAQGDLEAARAKHAEALGLRSKMGEKGLVAESRVAVAEVCLEEGNSGTAESAARQATDEFHAENEVDEEAYANALIARILAEERKYPQAEQTSKLAAEQSSKSEDRAVRLATTIMVAEVHAATGASAEARQELQSALAEAVRYRYVGYQLEARLALGRNEMNSGELEARSHLETLEKEARSMGFGLIARKAGSVIRSSGRHSP
jgi:ATP/maltotriose-dependent transcriptional regulator MalT